MSFTVKHPGGNDDNWEPVPAGVYQAVCYAVVDLGTHINQLYGNEQHKCWVAWELPYERISVKIDDEEVDKPRIMANFYTVSLHEKSILRKDLESWRGKVFSEQDLEGFDISRLLGVNCLLNVILKPNKKDPSIVKSVISSIMPFKANEHSALLKPENDQVYFSFEEHGTDMTENIPEGIKAMVMKSKEWNETGQHGEEWRQNSTPESLSPTEDPWSEPPPVDGEPRF